MDELNKFVTHVCFGDKKIALELVIDFTFHFENLIESIQYITKKDLTVALHNLSGSAGLMELITLNQELKRLEFLVEIKELVPRKEILSELHRIKIEQVIDLTSRLKE